MSLKLSKLRLSHFKPTTLLDRFYEAGLVIKAIDGFFESLSGILILVISPAAIKSATKSLTSHSLSKNPHNFWASYVAKTGTTLASGHNYFLAAFFLINGGVKLGLVICLFLNQYWAYPVALVILNLFLVYEIVQFIIKPTLGLAFLSLLDALIIWLIYREWQKIKKTPKKESTQPAV